jgi:NAD(P)-dependent dehydrogenase (short-subunit alcohol dehydrogenase family)
MKDSFGAETTTDDLLDGRDLGGRRAIVTGVSAGLGVEIARSLAAHGAVVIGTARDLEKARRATEGLDTGGKLEVLEMDLASLASVRACADAILKRGEPIDLIICNAGVMGCAEGKTLDGFETQLGTNHLGHFVFVNRLAPLLREGARVVTVSSGGHRFSDVLLDDPNFARTPYDEWIAYGQSKTANILFAVEFDRRYRDRGIRAIAVRPGSVKTELGRHLDPEKMKAMFKSQQAKATDPSKRTVWKTVPQGAATPVWAGVVADAATVGGRFAEDCHLAPLGDGPEPMSGVQPYAVDPERAKQLWEKSEVLVGESFPA